MKYALLALALAASTAHAETYPLGVYHCLDEQAGEYLIQISGQGKMTLIDSVDMGVVNLVYTKKLNPKTYFTADMQDVDGTPLGVVQAMGNNAEIRYPDKTSAQCSNQRPEGDEEIPQ